MTQTSRGVQNCALYVPCSLVVQLARVGVRVLVVDVVCVMLVLIARVIFVLYTYSFRIHFLQLEMYPLHHPSVTTNCGDCYRNDHCNFAPNSL